MARVRSFGKTSLEEEPSVTADEALWLIFSQTKVLVAAAVWQLVDNGTLRFADQIADHVPQFERNGKGEITLFDVLTHQGGFPSATVPSETWGDHESIWSAVCGFPLEWTPGSRVEYHGESAHWVAAMVIEAVTGRDFRDVIKDDLLAPLGLAEEIYVSVPHHVNQRCAAIYEIKEERPEEYSYMEINTPEFRSVGVPGWGGYASAAGMAAFYQMLLAGGELNSTRVLSSRVIQFATRNHIGDRVDEAMAMPMHWGLGPHLRGKTPTIRGLGTIASPTTFGHGGVGSSYSWGDPESGVSFSHLTNCVQLEPWHFVRMDQVSNLVHAAIVEQTVASGS